MAYHWYIIPSRHLTILVRGVYSLALLACFMNALTFFTQSLLALFVIFHGLRYFNATDAWQLFYNDEDGWQIDYFFALSIKWKKKLSDNHKRRDYVGCKQLSATYCCAKNLHLIRLS
jgi:hypothetical protein